MTNILTSKQEDTDDIHTVANHFEDSGYEIYAVIGHSRGKH